MLEYEEELYKKSINFIAGIDEVGRGPLIGPVVTACVVLPQGYFLEDIKDSKKINEKKRELLYDIIYKNAVAIGIGVVSAKRIDEINILEATKEAMRTAFTNCNCKIQHVLIDAVKLNLDVETTSIIKGDAKSQTIAAASIIAKVTRDRIMIELDKEYPMYQFKKNKGYGTKAHIEAIEKYGVLEEHRKTFKPIKKD